MIENWSTTHPRIPFLKKTLEEITGQVKEHIQLLGNNVWRADLFGWDSDKNEFYHVARGENLTPEETVKMYKEQALVTYGERTEYAQAKEGVEKWAKAMLKVLEARERDTKEKVSSALLYAEALDVLSGNAGEKVEEVQ